MKERPIIFNTEMVKAILEGRKTQTRRVIKPQPSGIILVWEHCPYGQVGDRLWVRETWNAGHDGQSLPVFKAGLSADLTKELEADELWSGWKPSIHMPRWASRITLEITEIRVERLQEITEEDAKAEGCVKQIKDGLIFDSAIHEYSWLWDSLNAKYPWESNPWVWVISFKGVT